MKKNERMEVLKELNSYLLVDVELNIIGKRTKKEISSITGPGITLTNSE